MAVERVFSVHVRCKDDSTWVAWSGDERFEAGSEEALRDRVRRHFLQKVADDADMSPDALAVNVRHTWRVVVTDSRG